MPTTIKLKNSVTTTAAPSSLVQGEVASNITDRKLWVGDASSTPVQILGAGAPVAGTTGTFTGNTTVAGTFAANGGTTLGDASGDALTINSSAVSIPNGLNFDSNTFVIDATNNRVGVGVASPATRLDAFGNGETNIAKLVGGGNLTLYSYHDAGGVGWATGAAGSYVNMMYMDSTNNFRIFTNSAERMRITTAGNVGIGTSSPAYKLDVAGSVMRLINSAATADLFLIDSGTTNGYVRLRGESNAMKFITGNGISATLDSSGNLGLGVTPSTWASSYKSLQIGSTAALVGASGFTFLNTNAFFDATDTPKYLTSTFASRYQQNDGKHAWYTAPSGTAGNTITFTQAMTLDASGQLSVGTTTPLYTASNRGNITINGSSSAILSLGVGGATSGYLFTDAATVQLAAPPTKYLSFDINGERMRIDTSGNLLVAKTSAGSPSSNGFEAAAAGYVVVCRDSAAGYALYVTNNNASGAGLVEFRRQTTTVGAISTNGTTTTYGTTSDYRLKENIAPMTGALAKVATLKPVTYTWKADGSDGQGFIAHELQEVCPDAVYGEKDAVNEDGSIKPQGIDTSFLVATLTAAIQELKAEVDSLKAQLNK